MVATEIPIGSEHEVSGVIDLIDMRAYALHRRQPRQLHRDPDSGGTAAQAQEYREKLMDEVAENSDALMERYLEGEEISHEEIVSALKEGTNHGSLFPVTCGNRDCEPRHQPAARRDRGGPPSPVKHGGLQAGGQMLEADEAKELFAYVFKTRADPFAGRINLFRVYQGVIKHDSHLLNTRAHSKERIGQLLSFDGAETGTSMSSAPAISAP